MLFFFENKIKKLRVAGHLVNFYKISECLNSLTKERAEKLSDKFKVLRGFLVMKVSVEFQPKNLKFKLLKIKIFFFFLKRRLNIKFYSRAFLNNKLFPKFWNMSLIFHILNLQMNSNIF